MRILRSKWSYIILFMPVSSMLFGSFISYLQLSVILLAILYPVAIHQDAKHINRERGTTIFKINRLTLISLLVTFTGGWLAWAITPYYLHKVHKIYR